MQNRDRISYGGLGLDLNAPFLLALFIAVCQADNFPDVHRSEFSVPLPHAFGLGKNLRLFEKVLPLVALRQ